MKREVRVTARVLTSDDDTGEDRAAAYEAVAKALLDAAALRRSGSARLLVPIEHPLVRFELDSALVQD